ncbi:MAG: uroporphyrinogen-III C-methyltransferase [Burkholderiales bacterium]|nr:uroporphyrinogen-III C-methyltransferase [Burkholderiales bacterium]
MRHFSVELRPAPRPATVTLVGAGPGDPELLTVKAARAIAAARIVLYDHLVSKAVLELVPPGTDLVYVGKESAHHTMPQEGIIALMIHLAQSGRPVLRLKGGDPYIFGRGGEEAQALAEAGVPFQVIPGISAAQGAAASAGIPLTHRDHAARVLWVTGHLRAGAASALDLDWPVLARAGQTLVVYMGVASLPLLSAQLIHHGLDPCTPAAVIERATLPEQRTLVGSVQSLPALALEQRVSAPALIIIGGVVGLRATLAGAVDTHTRPLAEAQLID